MKKIYMTLFAVIVFAGCQKEPTPLFKIDEAQVTKVNFDNLPKNVSNLIAETEFLKSKSFSKNQFGDVNKKFPAIKNTLFKDKISYTFLLEINVEKNKPGLIFDNLVITDKKNDGIKSYILRYKPTFQWYFYSERNLSNFSGEVEVFNLNGDKLSQTEVIDGESITKTNLNKAAIECSFNLQGTYCAGDEGGYGEAGGWTCTSTYTLSGCSSGSSYTPPSDTNDSPNEYDTASGAGSNDSGNNNNEEINTNPYLDSPCKVLFSEINGEDACYTLEEMAAKNLSAWAAKNDNINIDESVYDYPCLVEVLNQVLALDHNLVDETINKFCGNDDYKLTFTIGDCDGNPACTSDTLLNTTGEIVIKIQDVSLNPIDFATHILHESIHAEIFRYVDAHHNGEVDLNDKPQLFEYYARYKLAYDSTHIDHPYMTQYYIDPIAGALQKLDNFRYQNLDYYKVFAYDGLRDFDPYEDFVTIDEDFGQYRNEVTENFNVKCND